MTRTLSRRSALAFVLSALALPARAARADSGLRLLMIEKHGCAWCAIWRREVGAVYATSPQGRQAPLTVVPIEGPWPDGVVLDRRPYITPTFILLKDGFETGRIEGYPGRGRFFPLLDDLLRRTKG